MNLPKWIAAPAAALALLTSFTAFGADSKAGPQAVELSITDDGIQPSALTAKAGQPVKLTITRKTDSTCIMKVVQKDLGIDKDLPKDKPVTVEIAAAKPGTYRLSCGMGMTIASLKVQ